MGHRDAEGIHLSEENWAKISVDTMGFSSEKLIRALEAQMAGKQAKTQEGASLASESATARRDWMQNFFYNKLGFNLTVPLPPISDAEYNRRKEIDQELFYRPSTAELSYEALMTAVGQGNDWTLTESDKENIIWEPAEKGYWFWAEVAQNCPRLGTSWNILTGTQGLNLLSLEEYEIVFWAMKTETNVSIDTQTWSWLRTRFGHCALLADGSDGRVSVDRWIASNLAYSFDNEGGRCAEVVKM